MAKTPIRLGLTRDQLASFLQDFEQIKQFENLFSAVDTIYNVTIDEVNIAAGNANATANEANDSIQRLMDALDRQPSDQSSELLAAINALRQDLQLLPRPELGTMAPLQQADVPWLTFNNAPTPVPTAVGSMYWDGGTTLGIQATANVIIRVGEAEYVYAKASSAITKGQLCYHTGAVGSSGVITAAPTPINLADPNQIVGVAAETIALNGFGLIQISGDLRGFNTTGSSVGETWADGDPLYYNPAYVGSMTKVKPSAPSQKTYIGEVINAGSGGSGSMHIRIVPGSILGGTDSNVQFGTLANNDLIQYDSALQYWKNVPASSISIGTATNLAGGAANRIAYQTATNTTGFIVAPTIANTYLEWSGSAFQWSANPLGTVTSVAALTIGTTGTDLSSTVANSTTTPVITLNVPTASATNRGVLSTTDWSTFNSKQAALVSGTNIKTVGGVSLLGSGDVGIIGSAYGGTGNGFTKFTGPTTSEKTFTLPNSSATILTDNAAVTVAQGGTGQTTYTNGQLLIGNTTGNTLTKATLTAGTNVSITNGAGSITINATDQYTGTVTSVSGTGTVNGITLTGTVTSSGSLTLGGTLSGVSLTTQVSGTLPVGNGGTGATSFTSNYLLKGNSTSAITTSLVYDNGSYIGVNTTTQRNGAIFNIQSGTASNTTYKTLATVGGSILTTGQRQTTSVSTSATVISTVNSWFNFTMVFGTDGTNRFADLVLWSVGTGTVNVVSSLTAAGSPAARTYSQSSSTLRVAMASGTYTVNVTELAMDGF